MWLQASAGILAARIDSDETSTTRRPSLTGKSVQAEVADVLEQRHPLYQHAATLIVDAESDSPEIIAQNIFRQLPTNSAGVSR